MKGRAKMVRGALWIFLEKFGQQLLDLVVLLVVTRIIGPGEFGLASLCAVFSAFAMLFFFGIADGIISLKITDKRALSTIFWFIIAMGTALSLGIFLSAGLFASSFGEGERFRNLVEIFSVMPFLMAIPVVPTALTNARMEFKVLAVRTLLSSVVGGSVGVLLAINGFGAFSIVFQQIARVLVIILVVWKAARWTPALLFDRALLARVMTPGVKMTFSTLVSFVEQQMPRLFIGYFQSATELGYFALVSRIFVSIRETMIRPILTVLYPALVRIRDNSSESASISGQAIVLTGYIALPAVTGCAATADDFVPFFFGSTWEPAVPMLQILMFAFLPSIFLLLFREILRAQNKIGTFLRVQTIVVIAMLITIALSIPKGLIPMSWSLLFTMVLIFPGCVYYVTRMSTLSLFGPLIKIIPPILGCIAMGGGIALLRSQAWYRPAELSFLTLSIGVGAIIYITVILLTGFRDLRALKRNWKLSRKRID